MTVEVALVIAAISLVFGIVTGVSNLSRAARGENKTDAAQITKVLVRLEDISNDVKEIKGEMRYLKQDVDVLRERIIVLEQNTKRIDTLEKRINTYGGSK